ncbi:MAG: Hsp33 family molecular chaperone HslO [bacterium]|nr:Hsp33 family molecular chaperone HslO [bacterium]
MADELVRALVAGGAVRVLAAETTALVDEARRRHGTLPTATAALGRALTGAMLLAGTLKRDERLSLEWSGDGPLRGVLADATPDGDVRGYVGRPQIHLPPRAGKLDVGGAVGRGVLCVMRLPLAGGTLYRSIVPIVSGEIGDDLASYLDQSEQTPSAVAVGVWIEADGRVGAAGGYLLQALPDAPDDVLERLASRVENAPAPSELVRAGLGAAGMLGALLGETVPTLERLPVRFRCRCNRERVVGAMAALGPQGLAELVAEAPAAEVVCDFCATRYTFGRDDLGALLGSGST